MLIFKDEWYIFDKNNLIKLDINKEGFEIIKLYSPYVKHTKLIKYHYSKNNVIFFFRYR